MEVDETLLVVDAMAGQEAVNVAKTFNEKIGIDRRGADQDGRRYPRRCGTLGAGRHRQADLSSRAPARSWRTWNPSIASRMASRILGMGDVLSLIEKAQSVPE